MKPGLVASWQRHFRPSAQHITTGLDNHSTENNPTLLTLFEHLARNFYTLWPLAWKQVYSQRSKAVNKQGKISKKIGSKQSYDHYNAKIDEWIKGALQPQSLYDVNKEYL